MKGQDDEWKSERKLCNGREPVTAALVGFGAVARHGHLPWYLDGMSVSLAAVVEPTMQGRVAARELVPDIPVFSSLREMFNSIQVGFIDITAPPAAHKDLVLAALEADVDVICEKPFVTNGRELEIIERKRRPDGPMVAACHNWYYAPAIRRCLELIDAGAIGKPKEFCFTAKRSHPARGAAHWSPDWRQSVAAGGGIIADLGYHGIYLASRIFGSPPTSVEVNSVNWISSKDGADNAATVKLNYEHDRSAELNLSWLNSVRETVLTVAGSNGVVVISGNSLFVKSTIVQDFEERFDVLTADSWHVSWTSGTLDEFVRARRDAATMWRDIKWSIATLDAVYGSARSGGIIELPLQQPTLSASA